MSLPGTCEAIIKQSVMQPKGESREDTMGEEAHWSLIFITTQGMRETARKILGTKTLRGTICGGLRNTKGQCFGLQNFILTKAFHSHKGKSDQGDIEPKPMEGKNYKKKHK